MVERSVSYATGPALTPGEPGAVIRAERDGGYELVNLIWGFAPPEPGARPFTYVRSEGRSFDSRRCLIPASEFTVSNGQGKERRKWRATLAVLRRNLAPGPGRLPAELCDDPHSRRPGRLTHPGPAGRRDPPRGPPQLA